MRSKLSLLNGITGLISQFVVIILGFVSRSLLIEYLGGEILGLNGTFTNILSILSVTELGIGSAITFCLYKPVYENDENKIAGIMNLFKKVYSIIGIIILAGAICVVPFIQYLIKDYTLDLNFIRMIFVLYAFNSTISYFLGYCRILLFASQQNYIVTIVDSVFKVLLSVSQIIVLILTRNYVLYLLLVTVSNVSSNLIIRFIYGKKFEYLKHNKVKIDEESKHNIIRTVKYLSISQLISVGVFGTDNLIISSIIGVGAAGVYSNYTLIIQSVQNLFVSLLNGVTASLGNMMAEGDEEKINRIFNVYDFAYYLVASFTTISLFFLLKPFILDFWIKKEEYVLSTAITMVLVMNNYMTFKRQPIWQYQNTAGKFREFLPYSFMELILNLIISIVGAYYIGLIGVFLGTTVAYICSWLGQIHVVHKEVLHKSTIKYYFKQLKYMALTLIEAIVLLAIKNIIMTGNTFVDFGITMVLCAIIPNVINIILFYKTDEFKYLWNVFIVKLISRIKRST